MRKENPMKAYNFSPVMAKNMNILAEQIELISICAAGFEIDAKSARDTIKQLEAENKNLKEALEKYGEHSKNCYKNLTIGGFCDCGLTQALKGDVK